MVLMSDSLTEIACPNCLNPINIREHGQHVSCDACNSRFLLNGHICPNCNAYHQQEQAFCKECGEAMTRTCQKCQIVNWAGDEYCKQCGAALDIFQLLHVHHKQATADRLNQQMKDSRALKEKEEADSVRRLEEMLTVERMRLMERARQRRAQQKKDRFLVVGLIIVALVVIFLILIGSLYVL